VVVGADVIEHLRDPCVFLAQVYAALRPGGLLFLTLPSLDSWSARILGRHWMEYKLEHLYYFREATIRRLLRQAGYVDARIKPNVKVLSLDYIHQHFERFRVAGLSRFVRLARAIVPDAMAHRPFRVVPSGMMVLARKPVQ
jgi:hypothetical protein